MPLNQEALDILADLGAKDIDSVTSTLRSLDTIVPPAPPERRRQYADTLLALGERLFGARTETPLHVVFETVLQIGPADATARVRANAGLAAIFLGEIVTQPLASGCVAVAAPGFDAGRVDHYLSSIRGESEQVPKGIREWLLRLHALYWERLADYAKATDFAERAVQLEPTNSGRFVLGEIAFLWAKQQDSVAHACSDTTLRAPDTQQLYVRSAEQFRPLVEKRYGGAEWYLREVNHALGRDQETRQLLLSLLMDTPKDFAALRTLQYVCNEYLRDLRCSWNVVRALDSLHLMAPDDTSAMLDAAEIAVLVGDVEHANAWLGRVSRWPLPVQRQVIPTFYAVWMAIERRQVGTLPGLYDTWRAAIERFRRSGRVLSWGFDGAKYALANMSANRMSRLCADLLAQMIDALEKPTRPVPELKMACQQTR
jgi:tetratricopeptide (TPR) repeat protein